MIAIDFDYREEFIYWIDSSRPNGSRINRMCLNGSDIKVSGDEWCHYQNYIFLVSWEMLLHGFNPDFAIRIVTQKDVASPSKM